MSRSIVIVGAGQAGLQAAASLRQLGYAGKVTLIGDEALLPYQRPPLSKTYLGASHDSSRLLLRGAPFFEKNEIVVRTGEVVRLIDRAQRTIHASAGAELRYDHLILATGAGSRTLPVPGNDLAGVFTLRTAADAERIRAALAKANRMVVVGGGLIGLEMAAVANARGIRVTVVESAGQLAARTASGELSLQLQRWHSADGISFKMNEVVSGFVGEENRLLAVKLESGEQLEANLAIVSIGAAPNTALAVEAGLEVSDGVLVNEILETSDAQISAIGDCARFLRPDESGTVRLESVANAIEQGRCVASRLVGEARPLDFLPWSWSDQGNIKIQSAGWPLTRGEHIIEKWGNEQNREVCIYAIREDRLVSVECVNRPAAFARARKAMTMPSPVDLDRLDIDSDWATK